MSLMPSTAKPTRFLPTDASPYIRGGDLGFNGGEPLAFYLRGHHSDAAASITGRTGNIMVVDQTVPLGDGMQGPAPIHRTNVAMETAEINPIVVTATAPGPRSTMEEWKAAYGEVSAAQRLFVVHNPPFPGSWQFGEGEVDITFDPQVSTVDAADLIGSMVGLANGQSIPEAPTSTHLLAPTPDGPTGIRIHSWKPSRWHETHAIQMIDGGEEGGTVNRIMMMDSLV